MGDETETQTAAPRHVHPANNADRMFRWLSLAANVGVLAGLILVIVQINQSTQLARSAYRSEGNVVFNQIWADMMGGRLDAVSKSVECPEQMTHDDFLALDAYLFTSMNMLYRDYQLAQEGLYSESDWKGTVATYVHWYLGNPMGRAWWEEEARAFFPEEFANYVDEQLRHNGGRDHQAYWLAIRNRVVGGAGPAPPSVCDRP